MKYQRFVSLSAALSFIILFLSSGVLYFIPDRGSMGWSAWSFLGFDKQQWDNLHIVLGILFLVLMLWHIYFNFKAIKNYLKIKKELKVFTKEFNYALILVLLFMVGTITMTFPFNMLVNIGNGIKAKNAYTDGTPPFVYAQYATLEDFIKILKLDQEKTRLRLKEHAIMIDDMRDTLKKIAKAHQITPQTLYTMMIPSHYKKSLPSSIPVGIAHHTLEDLSGVYKLDVQKVISHFKTFGINAKADSRFKKLAKEYDLHPATLYAMLLASQIE